jgi:FAD/FMN-containing dehydrogenase
MADRVHGTSDVNRAYLEDASGFQGHAERLFVPRDDEELAEILRRASSEAIPVTIAGGGTGLTGGRVAQGGWVISLEKFNHLEIDTGRARAGAGVLLADLHAAAERSGQFYGPDPTETAAFVGGTIATNASGSRSFRYGDTRRHILGLRIALAGGRRMTVKRGDKVDFPIPSVRLPRTTKHSAGFRLSPAMDWIDLFAGSEGTLGVIVEAELQLMPLPKALLAGVVFFKGDDAALDAVEAWRGCQGLRMIEYFDKPSLDLLQTRISETPKAAGAALLIEQGLASEEDEEIDRWEQRLTESSALADFSWFGMSARERERFRVFRHTLPEIVNDIMRQRGFLKVGSDYAVPTDRNREMLALYRRRLEEIFPGRYVIFGHIGDAHLHVNILPSSEEEFQKAGELMLEFARHAVGIGGTVSAEHGLGKRKAHLLAIQYTPDEIAAMKEVKRRLDPQWLLGRGNLFPEG